MQKFGLFLGALGALALIGCNSGSGRGGGDDDDIVLMDGGMDTDSGSGGGTDSGSGGGTDSGSGGGTDSGGGGSCPPQTVPAPDTSPCAMATLTCLTEAQGDGMITDAEFEACLSEDPMRMACEECFNQEVLACATTNGCDDEWGEIVCCGEENCGSATDVGACLQSMCSTQVSAMQSCVMGLEGTCGITTQCFMSGG